MDEREKTVERENREHFNFLKSYLEEFKKQILSEIKVIISQGGAATVKKWMKSNEVKKLLNISHGKLQTMRNSRVITFTKIGGSLYYDRDDIHRMFEENKVK